MENVRNYFHSEMGYETFYDNDNFCIYSVNNDEFFIAHFYVKDRKTTYSFFDKVKDLARKEKCLYLSGNVDMNESNYGNYTNKLLVHLKHGYKVARITENRITVVYAL